MKKLHLTIGLFFALSVLSSGYAQTQTINCNPLETKISGEYHSKNLFIQQTTANSILEIAINGKSYKLGDLSTAFEINLSDLKVLQAFEISIKYCEGKGIPYKILNPEVLK